MKHTIRSISLLAAYEVSVLLLQLCLHQLNEHHQKLMCLSQFQYLLAQKQQRQMLQLSAGHPSLYLQF